VQLPGRWNRHSEPAISGLALLVDKAIDGLADCLGNVYALFGHSVGSLVAFEFARALRRRNLPGPSHLFVSGRRAPHLPGLPLKLSSLGDAALISQVGQRYGALPESLLNDSEMLALVLPPLRSDLMLDEGYEFVEEPPLSCPITVFGGASDHTTSPESLAAWRQHTNSLFRVQMFPGGHFYLDKEMEALLRQIDHYWDNAG
jgi:medium-chain acyl-[acyl-carrier-protein] hydrolase